MIVRFFRAITHEGKSEEFQSVFLEHVLPLIRSHEGLISASVGLPHEGSPNEFSMHMIWRDLDAIRGFTGENWGQAVVLPEEEGLLKETFVHHYVVAE